MTTKTETSLITSSDQRLADALPRQPMRVVGVLGADALAERLQASGLWVGAEVSVVGAAPFGDPLLAELHGFRLALRRSEAERVVVLPAGGGESAGSRS